MSYIKEEADHEVTKSPINLPVNLNLHLGRDVESHEEDETEVDHHHATKKEYFFGVKLLFFVARRHLDGKVGDHQGNDNR